MSAISLHRSARNGATGPRPGYASVIGDRRKFTLVWLAWFLAILGATGITGLALLRFGPKPAFLAWLLYLCGAVAIFYRPRYGIYLILFFGLMGDNVLNPWYPFTKNFSSAESIFYLHRSLIISPLEAYIAFTYVSWLVRVGMRRKLKIQTGRLFWASCIFLGFIVAGMAYGFARGGNVNIGLWEARPIFYLPAMLLLVSNLIVTKRHVNNLMASILAALVVEAGIGSYYFLIKLKASLALVDAITEHSAAIHLNSLFIFVLAAWIYQASPAKRYILLPVLPLVAVCYLAEQRRAAFLTLAIALAALAIVLFTEKRKLFWIIIPPLAVVFSLYMAAFWNRGGTLGLPAQAIKSVISQDQADASDQMSNYYRYLENLNSSFTIHMAPITGVGFGRKFFILVPMPDISFFVWWEYITHNSIVWIWIKTGVGGFMALLYMVGLTLFLGARAVHYSADSDMRAIALTGALYVLMHFMFAYVDMSWDNQSMIYVGTMMGIINEVDCLCSRKNASKRL